MYLENHEKHAILCHLGQLVWITLTSTKSLMTTYKNGSPPVQGILLVLAALKPSIISLATNQNVRHNDTAILTNVKLYIRGSSTICKVLDILIIYNNFVLKDSNIHFYVKFILYTRSLPWAQQYVLISYLLAIVYNPLIQFIYFDSILNQPN